MLCCLIHNPNSQQVNVECNDGHSNLFQLHSVSLSSVIKLLTSPFIGLLEKSVLPATETFDQYAYTAPAGTAVNEIVPKVCCYSIRRYTVAARLRRRRIPAADISAYALDRRLGRAYLRKVCLLTVNCMKMKSVKMKK